MNDEKPMGQVIQIDEARSRETPIFQTWDSSARWTMPRCFKKLRSFSCLRKPVASASAIKGMKSGRPIVVADAGFYADLPDDMTAYVDKLEGLLNEFIAAKPLLGLCKRFGRELAGLGISADEPAVARIASTMHNLFIGNPAPPDQEESNDLHDIRNSLSTVR
jgi:hypothetical protein